MNVDFRESDTYTEYEDKSSIFRCNFQDLYFQVNLPRPLFSGCIFQDLSFQGVSSKTYLSFQGVSSKTSIFRVYLPRPLFSGVSDQVEYTAGTSDDVRAHARTP